MSESNYVREVIDKLAELVPDCEFDLLRFYALLVLTKGTLTTLSDVHDAWSCWRLLSRPNHAQLVVARALSFQDAEKDLEYVVAIRTLAATLTLQNQVETTS